MIVPSLPDGVRVTDLTDKELVKLYTDIGISASLARAYVALIRGRLVPPGPPAL